MGTGTGGFCCCISGLLAFNVRRATTPKATKATAIAQCSIFFFLLGIMFYSPLAAVFRVERPARGKWYLTV
jgi:hypothetical protein